jgi:hypothetical protein
MSRKSELIHRINCLVIIVLIIVLIIVSIIVLIIVQICCSVLEDAVQAPDCEHTFCNDCINEWLQRQNNCPVDRQLLNSNDLKPAPRVLRNFLAKLDIKCEYGIDLFINVWLYINV